MQDSDLDLNYFSNRQGDLSDLKSENKSDENPNHDAMVEDTSDKNITFVVKGHFSTYFYKILFKFKEFQLNSTSIKSKWAFLLIELLKNLK